MERGDPGDDEREGLLAGSHGPTTQPPPERARERPEVAAEAVELEELRVREPEQAQYGSKLVS